MNRANRIPTRFRDAVARIDGNEELLKQMAGITSEDLPEILSKTKSEIGSGDCEAAGKSLHKLKGMLSTFETDGVVLDLQEMIQVARRGNRAELQRLYDEHEPQVDELVAQIADLADYSEIATRRER